LDFLLSLNFWILLKGMKKSLFVIILILFGFSVMAQSGFRPGFIIKNNGDTLNGQIFYGSNGKFKNSCLFKRFEIAQEVSYSSDKIRGYGFVNGRYFESKTIGRKKTFLECLVKGDVSVYIVPGKHEGSVYLQSSQTGLFKLDKGSNQLEGCGTFGNFRDALACMLNKTGNKSVPLQDVNYDSKEIAAVVRESTSLSENATKGFCQTPGVHNLRDKSFLKEGSILSFGLIGGYQFIAVHTLGPDNLEYFTAARFNKSFRPVMGLYINTRLSKISDHWSVDLAIQYLADSYYAYSEHSDGVSTFRDDIMIDFSEIQVPLALRFTFGNRSIRPYFKAGLYKSFLIDRAYRRESEEQHGVSVYTDSYEDFELHNVLGLVGGAGIQFKLGKARLLSIEGIYTRGSQVLKSKYQELDIKTSGISIMARINL
jgi:hypothetical protein